MAEGTENTGWIHPETRQKAVQRARYRANAARWDINIALFLFGVIVAVCILGSGTAGLALTAFVAVSGLSAAWFWGWIKARRLYPVYLEEELARYPDEWKDYYGSLGIGPNSDAEAINEAYEHLSYIYTEVLSDKTKSIPLYSMMYKEATEAYRVLSDPDVRMTYDRVYWLKCNGCDMDTDESATSEIVGLSDSITREVTESLGKLTWKLPGLSRTHRRVITAVIAVFLLIGICGTSLAFTSPDHALATPFRGTALAVARVSSGALGIIDDVRSVGAMSEQQVISTMVQLMRIQDGVKYLTPVMQPTNDMASFPSPENSLYPEYIDRRYSQFRYTMDSNGIVTVHTDWAVTDPLLERIKLLIYSLD